MMPMIHRLKQTTVVTVSSSQKLSEKLKCDIKIFTFWKKMREKRASFYDVK